MSLLTPNVARACMAELQKLAEEPKAQPLSQKKQLTRLRELIRKLLRRSLTGKALHVAGVGEKLI